MRPEDAALLHRLQHSGGYAEILQGELSAAIRLGVFGLGKIAGQPQAVTLTAQGRAWRPMFGEFAA